MKFTKAQIERSIKTGRLSMDGRDLLRYFKGGSARLVFFVLLPVAIFVFLTNIQISYLLIAIGVVSLVASVFAIFSVLKALDLRLVKVETDIPEKQVREMIVAFSRLKKWKVSNNRKSLVILKTGPGRSGNTGWGERITLMFQGREVWISSISDPDRPMAISSHSRNKDNVGFMQAVLAGRRIPANDE